MRNIPRRKLLILWLGGTLLVGLSAFWTVYILWPGALPGQRMPHAADALPPVELNDEAEAFVDALPELGREHRAGTSDVPRIIIPRLSVEEAIVESPLQQQGWFIDGLESRIAHLEGTDAPGGDGNAVFAGHITLSDNSPGPLVRVDRLVPGDAILVVHGPVTYQYEVVGRQQVGEDRLEVVYPTQTPTLTLITCSSWSWFDGRYTSRQVVTARLTDVVHS
jgi:LPXTG-site transpeptidase (sortase) family protein